MGLIWGIFIHINIRIRNLIPELDFLRQAGASLRPDGHGRCQGRSPPALEDLTRNAAKGREEG